MTEAVRMKLKLPAGCFGAYLFDCDGTIVDSMPLHYVAWREALAEWDCSFDEQVFYAWGGIPVAEIIARLNERQGLNMPVERVSSRKESLYLEMLPQLKVIPAVVGAYRRPAWADSSCGRVRKQAGLSDLVSDFGQASR
jgi:beta-phosphoglucomutase-like phosphatase (HAD superfamily)